MGLFRYIGRYYLNSVNISNIPPLRKILVG